MKPSDEQKLAELKAANPDWGRVRLARELGLSEKAVRLWLEKLKKQALYSDAPEGFYVNKRTVHVDSDGNVKQQWIKTAVDREMTLEALKLAAGSIVEPITGQSPQIKQPRNTDANLMVCYPIADAHTGLYAWKEETGTDFDADKCGAVLYGCMKSLVDAAPASETCLILNLGDFFHSDTAENKTMRSGHSLDVDTRWARVFQIGVKTYRSMIELALAKHKKVYVKSGIGNHDDHSIFSLAMLMQAYFENNDRVEIELPINPFAYHEFHKNLIGANHGEVKADRLPLIMAYDQSEAWGRTKHRVVHVGHLHSKALDEYPGCTVERHRSPSAKDAWTHRSGYRSERDMQSITYHAEHGEVGRNRISVESLT